MAGEKVKRGYPIVGAERRVLPPSYDRVVRAMPDAELEDEILGGKGEPGYQLALIAEQDRRSKAGPPPEPPTVGRGMEDADEWVNDGR